MKITKLYLSKNTRKETDKQPDLKLAGITDEGTFINIAAFWKSKSGKGYSGKVDEKNATINCIITSGLSDKAKEDIIEIKKNAGFEPSSELLADNIPF